MAFTKITSDGLGDNAVTADKIASGAVTVADIPDGEITAAKLHTTAISSKLGYTPVSPTDLSSGLATKADASTVNAAIAAIQVTPTQVSDQSNTSTGYFDLPSGTDAQRPGSPNTGNFRFNTTANAPEFHNGSAWISLGLKDGSTQALAATSASDIRTLTGTTVDGSYWIKPVNSPTAFQVHCNMSAEGGGWMLTLRNTSNELGPFSSGSFLVSDWTGWGYNTKTQIDTLGFNYATAEDTNCFTPVYAYSPFTDVMVIANRAGQQSKRVGWRHSSGFSNMHSVINDPSEKVATSVLFGNAYNWLSSLDIRSDTNVGGATNTRVGFKIRADTGSNTSSSSYVGGFWTSSMHYGSQIGCGRESQDGGVWGGGFGGYYANSRYHRLNGHWWNHGDGRSSAAWSAGDQSSGLYGHAVYVR